MRRPLRLLTLLALTSLAACAPEGPSAFVTFNIRPTQACTYAVESGSSDPIATGKYDISGASRGSETCGRPYFVHLLVNSWLRANSDATLGRAEPNILQLDRAEVKLMTLQKETIDFVSAKEKLFNPFLVTTNNSLQPATGSSPSTGLATIEAIPAAYSSYLQDFKGQQILAEIQIFGTTTGDVDIDFKPFVYPIEICEGCLVKCMTMDKVVDADDFIKEDSCNDGAGADDRFCIDPDC